MPSRRAAVLGGTVLTLVLAGAAGTAWAAGPSASPSPSASSAPGASGKAASGKAGPLRGLEHGTLVVRRGGADRTVTLQRGRVTAVSPTSLTVVSRDGFSGTYALSSTTKVRAARAAGSVADLHVGDRVGLRAVEGAVTVVRDAGQ